MWLRWWHDEAVEASAEARKKLGGIIAGRYAADAYQPCLGGGLLPGHSARTAILFQIRVGVVCFVWMHCGFAYARRLFPVPVLFSLTQKFLAHTPREEFTGCAWEVDRASKKQTW